MKIKCLIIDDEQLARDLLEAYVKEIPDLEVLAKCKNALEAEKILQSEKVDLLFLDIQMPLKSGIDFLRQLRNPPKVILTTAFKEYALEGYELEIVDYLLKPIGFERFKIAVSKVNELLLLEHKAQAFEHSQSFEQQYLLVKVGHNHQKVLLKDILYISAMREYVQYHSKQARLMELRSISSVEAILPQSHFLRIHRSFIIQKSAVIKHQGNKLFLKDGVSLSIGKTYKKKVLKELF